MIRLLSQIRRLAALGMFSLWSAVAMAEHYTVPLLVPAGTSDGPQGVVRILNGTAESGVVEIYAINDAGIRSGPATFTLNASAAAEFTATDLASGSGALGLTGGIGTDVGDARLQIETELAIVPLAFVRAADGTQSAMHDTVRGASATDGSDGHTYEVPIVNPSSDVTQVSRLRLINPGDAPAAVSIAGRDDSGAAATGGEVTLMLAAGAAQTLTAQQLEAGDTAITGRLGAGTGKWRLTVASDQPLQVINIVAATTGHWSNLSTTAVRGAAPADLASFNDRFAGETVVLETDGGRSSLMIMENARFSETEQTGGMFATGEGGYDYVGLGTDAGRVTLDHDDGSQCRANLYFSSRTRGWFASHCSGGADPNETRSGGNWFVGDDENDRADVDPVETTSGMDETLPGVPTSGQFIPVRVSGGSVRGSAAGTTIDLNDGGYFDLNDGTRYTCASAGGCQIVDGTVTRGRVIGRTSGSGGGEIDRFPVFATEGRPGNLAYTVGTAIDALTLPEAADGNPPLTYSLLPEVPGLSFDAAARRLAGTPTAAGSYAMSYTVTDADGDLYTFRFTIEVAAGAAADGSADDRAALEALYNAAGGANWTGRSNWLSDEPLDEWYGVSTDSGGRVTGLNLDNNQLTGSLPSGMQLLAGLEELRLHQNQLSGPVPAELGGLANLRVLNLGDNEFSGPIPPELGQLAGLEELRLYQNQLSGPIPAELGGLANLRILSLGDNEFAGPIPPELGQLADLEVLRLYLNELTGPVPAQLGGLANLRELNLGDNELTESIPPELGRLADLEVLLFYQNQLTGSIPAQLGGLANLRVLSLGGNEFTGSIPSELGQLAGLEELRLYQNRLTGPVPAQLGGLANLRELNLGDNELSGSIPPELGQLAELELLRLYLNQLAGPIPAQLGGLAHLRVLSLGGNEFSGSIAPELGQLADLEALYLWGNQLSGSIPPELGRLSELEVLQLSDNQLSGSIPSQLGELSMLRNLRLSGNPFSGCIPSGLRDVADSDLSALDLPYCADAASPDLVVESSSVSDSEPGAGESFTFRATVRNRGDASSAATTLRFYRSTTATISRSDTLLGTGRVGRLSASGTSLESITLTAPLSPGTYYYGACVDSVTGESDTTNNCSASVQVTASTPSGPDLNVYFIAVATSLSGPDPGELFGISAGVRNDGNESSPATTVRFYQSTDATITTSDTQVGTDNVAELAAGASNSDLGADVAAPSTAGTYYYGACVDAVTGETDTTDNCSRSTSITVR